MRNNKNYSLNIKSQIIIFALFFWLSFSTSIDLFRKIDPDFISPIYLSMSNDDYNVRSTMKYRFLIPKLVSSVKNIFPKLKYENLDENEETYKNEHSRFIFFAINNLISTIAAFITFFYLLDLGMGFFGAILGAIIFLTSRAVVLSNGLPMIDSLQYLSLALYSKLITNKNKITLAFLFPFMAIVKETISPLVFLTAFRNMRKHKLFIFSIFASLLFILTVRSIIDELSSVIQMDNYLYSLNIYEIFTLHLPNIKYNLISFFSIKGIYKFSYTFGPYILLSVLGFIENKNKKDFYLSHDILILIPYSILLSLLSKDIGRILFISFPVVIPYSVYFINNRIKSFSR